LPVRPAGNAVSQPFPSRAASGCVEASADRLCFLNFENPMISLLKISKCGMIIFLVPKGARLADCPLSSAQGLENAQNGKGWLLAEVGMDLGSAPRSLGPGAVLRPVS